MAVGAGFAHGLGGWLRGRFGDDLPHVIVFVPTSRVAARVRAVLARDFTGVLPAVIPLKGNGELADLLGFAMPARVDAAAARIEIYQVLKRLGSASEDGNAPPDMPGGERLWRRVDGIYRMLDRLALHGLGVSDLRRTVPANMAGLWDVQADLLVQVAAHMERWLARRGDVLPGGAERRVLVQAGEILNDPACAWVPVVAGVVDAGAKGNDGTTGKAELGILRAAAARGAVVGPELGDVTAGLVAELEDLLDAPIVRLGTGGSAAPHSAVVETEWDEAWAVALAVRRWLGSEASGGTMGVVSPSAVLLRRVSALLGTWGIVAPVRGELCLDHTPAGREVLGKQDWGLKAGRVGEWVNAVEAFAGDGFEAVKAALLPLHAQTAWLELEDWQALMGLVLGETPAPAGPVTGGVLLLGPLDARLVDFDYVIAAGCVEGVWPATVQDAWLSEPHLRALGMADSARSARLAGTEFESVVLGGSRSVLVTRSRTAGGREVVASRFVEGIEGSGMAGPQDVALLEALAAVRDDEKRRGEPLGVFEPTGDLWPKRWSASFVEAMLACPYRALGERILKLEPLDPLVPDVDARVAGLLAHRWLEKTGTRNQGNQEPRDSEAWVAELLEIGEMELRKEPAVIRAIWRSKMKKLAPALVAQWQADGRDVAAVEKRLSRPVGAVQITATADRIERGTHGVVIVDFKTSTPPSWASVASGVRPQLAIEAWLLEGERNEDKGERTGEVVAGVEYWHLRGYGTAPLTVLRAGEKKSPAVAALVAPVENGLGRLVDTFGEGAAFVAVPDMAGGGLMATGHCERCALAGVCRRKVASHV